MFLPGLDEQISPRCLRDSGYRLSREKFQDRFPEFTHIDRLGDIPVSAEGEPPLTVFLLALGRDDDDRRVLF